MFEGLAELLLLSKALSEALLVLSSKTATLVGWFTYTEIDADFVKRCCSSCGVLIIETSKSLNIWKLCSSASELTAELGKIHSSTSLDIYLETHCYTGPRGKCRHRADGYGRIHIYQRQCCSGQSGHKLAYFEHQQWRRQEQKPRGRSSHVETLPRDYSYFVNVCGQSGDATGGRRNPARGNQPSQMFKPGPQGTHVNTQQHLFAMNNNV